MFKTKRAFTFAELMISLVIIGVITLIMYPTVSDLTPNNNKYLFKETYQTITMIVSDYINTTGREIVPVNAAEPLCQIFCERLNIRTANGNNNLCPNCTNFTTSNGMRWAFTVNDNTGYVLVDVNVSNNRLAGNVTNYDRKPDNDADVVPGHSYSVPRGAPDIENVWTNTTGIQYTSDTTTCDTFLFSVSNTGRVSPVGAVAATHLQSDD